MAKSSVNVKFNTKQLIQKSERAFVKANKTLEAEIIGSIASPIWDWNGTTTRRNKDVVTSPRDIIDEGGLLDGYQEPRMQGKNVCIHEFTAPYTQAIHDGAQLRNGGVVQARPFTEIPVRDFPRMFIDAYRDS